MARRLRFNEGKACDAVLRRLEAREGAPRVNLRSPERERHPVPVELACEINGRLFAIEHTGIEPFAGHMVEANHEAERIDRIREACQRKFPRLARWKCDYGARTVLVLEENDI